MADQPRNRWNLFSLNHRRRAASPLSRRLRLEPLEARHLLAMLLPGDYNLNATVDAADYVVWRNSLGTNVPAFTLADGDGDATIGQGDYNVWRANFGNHAPTDANESFSVQPNVGVIVSAANGLLLGATDPDPGNVLTMAPSSVGTFATSAGGSIAIAADGSFNYTPQAGDRSLGDTFTYSVRDPLGATDTSTVTFNLNGQVIWFVDLSAAAGGNGTVASPYNSLLSLDDSGVNPDANGDTIFVYRTTAGGGTDSLGGQDFDLQANQLLIGEGITGAAGDTINTVRGFTTQTYSRALPTINGDQHTLTTLNSNALTLSTGNTLRGLDVGATGTGTKIVGSAFGTFSVDDVGLSGAGGALNLTNGTIQGLTGGSAAVFNDLSSSSSANAISLTTVAGNLSGPAGSSLAGATGATIVVSGGTISLTYSGNVTQANNAALVDINGGHTTGTITFNTGTLSATNGTGLQFNNADSTTSYNFNGTTTLNGGDAGIDIIGGSGGTFTFGANTSINNPSGIAYREDTSTANVTYSGTIAKTNNANRAVAINAKTGGTTTFTGQINASTTTANAVDLTGNAGGTINFNSGGNGLDITTTSGIGFNATGGGTITVQGSGNSIATATGQIVLADGINVGSLGIAFATLGASGVVAADAVSLNNVDGAGTFNGGAVTIAGTSGATSDGIAITGGSAAAFTFASATIDNTAAHGINLNGANGAVTFTTVDIDGVSGDGINVTSSTSSVNINGGLIGSTNDPANNAVEINGGNGNVTIAAPLTKTSGGKIVLVTGRTGGTITLSGNLSATGGVDNGIDVNTNTSGTINFTGQTQNISTGSSIGVNLATNGTGTINFNPAAGGNGLDVATTTAAGFSATGGGTVTVQGSGNTISSTNATALNITNTTVGASGATFLSISAGNNDAGADPANGIVLNNTGMSGGLAVTGDGGGTNNGSGGIIQHTTGDAISLTTTENVRLGYMNITNNLGDGIGGSSINGFVLNRMNISTNGNDAATDESGINIAGLFGSASGGTRPTSLTNCVISNNNEFELQITNSSGTLTNLQLAGNTISSNGLPINGLATSPHGDLFNFLGLGTSTMGLTVTSGTFTGNWNPVTPPTTITGTGIMANSGGTSMTANISGATFTNNNAGIDVSTDPVATTFTFNISGNTITGSRAVGINHFNNGNPPFNRTINGTIANNTIGTLGTAGSGSQVGNGIALSNEGAVAEKLYIHDNTIQEVQTAPGISLNVGLGGQATGGGETDITVTNNIIRNIGSRALALQDNQVTDIANPPGAGPFPTVFANISGNTFSGIAGQAGNGQFMRLRKSYGTFKVTQDSPTGGNTTTELDNANNFTNPALINLSAITGAILFTQGTPPLPTTNPLPLTAAGSGSGSAADLTAAELGGVAAAAIDRFAAAGANAAQLALLKSINFQIVDFAGSQLGSAGAGVVQIDVNGAGWGYFVDQSPYDDGEFDLLLADSDRGASDSSAAHGHIDLLSVVLHEMGHILGYDHDKEGVMSDTLNTGVRHTDLDALFADEDAVANLFS